MQPRDRVRLKHMADAIDAALRFAEGRDRHDLDRDEMLRFALIRAIEIVGEAASKISSEGKTKLPDLPWAAIVGMRNRLIHAYYDVDLDILWSTVREALPKLQDRLRALPLDR